MSYDANQDIPVAEIVAQRADNSSASNGAGQPPSRPPSKSKSCLIPVLIALGLVLSILIGGGVAVYRALAPPNLIVETEEEAETRRANDQAKISQAFSSDFVPADPKEFDQIEKLVVRISSFANDEVNSDLHECIDFERYAREARRNPEAKRLAYFGNAIFAATARQRTVGPIPFSQYRIFEIETISENERKITLQTWGTYDDIAPYVWWVARTSRDEWKLYDWEPIEFGVRDSKESAVLLGEDNVERIRAYETYVDAVIDYVEETDDLSDSTKQKLLDCQSLAFHESLADSSLFNIATHFESNHDYKSAKTFLTAIKNKKATPGVFRLLGEIALRRNEFEDAVNHFQAYVDLIGPTRNVLTSLAEAHEELGDDQNELKFRRLAIPMLYEAYSPNLGRAFFLESKDNLTSLFSAVEKNEEPIGFLKGLVNQTSSNPFAIEKFESLVNYLDERTTKPNSNSDADRVLAIEAKAELAFTQGEFEKGLELLASPLVLAADSESYDYWERAVDFGVVIDKFKVAEDKEKALETLAYIYDEYEFEMEAADFVAITNIALKAEPDNAVFNHFAGLAAFEESDFETAIQFLSKAKLGFESDPENDYAEYNASLLSQSHYSIGNVKDAVDGINEDQLKAIIYIAIEKKNLSLLKTQIDNLELPEDRDYFNARLLMENGKYEEAKATFVRLLKTFKSDPNAYGSQYRNISSLIECCRLNGAINDAFLETHRKDVFDRVARTLINDKDWEAAERLAVSGRRQLAKRTSRAVDLQSVLNLEHEMLWHQGKFKELADSLVFDRDVVKIEQLEDDEFPNLEFIFRAALRTNNLILADHVASLTRNLKHPNFEILRLMALHQKDYKRFEKLKLEYAYNLDAVFDDPDCPKLSKKKILELTDKKPAQIEVGYGGYYQLHTLGVLLSEPIELDSAAVNKISSETFSDPFLIEELADQPDGGKGWLVRSGKTVLAISQHDNLIKPTNVEDKELATLMNDGEQMIAFEFFSLDWRPSHPYIACLNLADFVEFENATVISLNNEWMPWSEGKQMLGKLKSESIRYSDFKNDIESQFFYFEDSETTSSRDSTQFQLSFANAYRQFIDSDSSDKRLIVSTRIRSGKLAETINVEVEKIELGSWGMNEVEGKLTEASRMNPQLEKGDAVVRGTGSIFRWKLMLDGDESSNELK